MVKIRYITVLLIATISCSGTRAQQPLDHYLELAAQNNPELQARFNEYMAAMARVPQVGALPDPGLAFGYFISPAETRLGPQQFKVSISQTFPWFGLLNAREDVATERARALYETFEEARSRLFYNVKATYYNYYFNEKATAITTENLDILKIFKNLAAVKIEAGLASVVDELRVDMEINDLENQLSLLNDNRTTLKTTLNDLMDTTGVEITVPDSLWIALSGYSLSQISDSINAKNHRLIQIEHRILAWDKQQSVAKKAGMPTFKIGADYTMVGKTEYAVPDPALNGRDILLLPKVSMTIPLYRKKYDAMVEEAALEMKAANFEKKSEQNRLNTLLVQLNRDLKDAERRVALFREQRLLAQHSLDILLADYSTNGSNFEEVLRMERKVLKYKLEQDKARADRNTATGFINYLMGN